MPRPQYKTVNIPVFSLEPNWDSNVIVRNLFHTIIRESLDTSEERQGKFPRSLYGIRYTVTGMVAQETAYLRKLLELANAMPVVMPVWTDATKLTEAISIGTHTLKVQDVSNTLFTVLTKYALVWTEFNLWQLLEVSDVSFDTITLVDAVTVAAGVGTLVLPVLIGKLPRSSQNQVTDEMGVFSVDFEERFNGLTNQGTVETDYPSVAEMAVEYANCKSEFTLIFPMINASLCVIEISEEEDGPYYDHIFAFMTEEMYAETGGLKRVRVNNAYKNGAWFRPLYHDYASAIDVPIARRKFVDGPEVPPPIVKISGVIPGMEMVKQGPYIEPFSNYEQPCFQVDDLYIAPTARFEYRFNDWSGNPPAFDYTTEALTQVVEIDPSGHFLVSATVAAGGSSFVAGEMLKVDDGVFSVPAILRVLTPNPGPGALLTFEILERGVYSVSPTNPIIVSTINGTGSSATINGVFGDYTPDGTGLVSNYSRDRSEPLKDAPEFKYDHVTRNIAVTRTDFGMIVKARFWSDTCKSPMTMVMVDKRGNDYPMIKTSGHGASITGGACDDNPGSSWACPVIPPFWDQIKRMECWGLATPYTDRASHNIFSVGYTNTTGSNHVFNQKITSADFNAAIGGASWIYDARIHHWELLPSAYANAYVNYSKDGVGVFGNPILGSNPYLIGAPSLWPFFRDALNDVFTAFSQSLALDLEFPLPAGGVGPWSQAPLDILGFEIFLSAYNDNPQANIPYLLDIYPAGDGATSYKGHAGITPPAVDTAAPTALPDFDALTYAGDDFEFYADGDATSATLDLGYHWSGAWVIRYFPPPMGEEIFETYDTGAIDARVLNAGDLWGGAWVINQSRPNFADDFETYAVHVLVRGEPQFTDGTGWSGGWFIRPIPVGLDDFESYALGAITTGTGGEGWTTAGWRIS